MPVVDYIPPPPFRQYDPYVRKATLLPADKNGGRHAVYDGDSVKMYIDNGFFQEAVRIETRFNRINTYEITRGTAEQKRLAKEARDWLRETLEKEQAEHGFFWIHSVDMEQGKFGRWIVEVYLHNGTNVNDELVRRGWGVYQEY